LELEGQHNVRNKVGDAVAEIARQYTEEGILPCNIGPDRGKAANVGAGEQWPELLGTLFQLSNSADVGQREAAFRIFATTPGIIEKQHEEVVLSAFTKGFKDDDASVTA